jgi:DNA-binding SARP family transcriptional activator/TolB-like protein
MQKPPFELRILGPTELHGPVGEEADALVRQSKRLALLAYLALSTADGFRRRDQIIAFFWPELDQTQARTYLRKALYGIREGLGQEVFLTRGEDEVRVDPALVWCDAVALSQHVREGRWSEGLSVYRGELLEGLFPEGVAQEFQDWLSAQRKQLRERAAQAAWECSRLEEERGDRTAAAVMARRARELDPDNEEGVRRLMGLLDRRGDRGSALRVYQEWQARLQEEFGVEPAPETRKLARQVQAARKGESHETAPVQPPVAASPADTVTQVTGNRQVPVGRRNRATRWLPGIAAAGVLAIVALGAATLLPDADSSAGPRSIAVLPLRTIGDSSLQNSAQAIAEEITTRLAMDTTISVRMVPSPQERAQPAMDITELGKHLGTAYVADGGIQHGGDRIRITLRLVRTVDAVAVWAGDGDIKATDLVGGAQRLGSEFAAAIASRLPK